jgi:hypothetical protein
MPFQYDATQVRESGGFDVLPGGWYELKIEEAVEKISKNGNDMVSVKCTVTEPIQYLGRLIYHNVTFLPPSSKGANMSLHFLNCINEPSTGSFTVNAARWRGKRFRGKIVESEYQGKRRNEIKAVSPLDQAAAEEEVPF